MANQKPVPNGPSKNLGKPSGKGRGNHPPKVTTPKPPDSKK